MKPSPRSAGTRVALVAGLAALTFAACTSEPSPHRVAEDLINSLAETDEERDCMLEILDGYSNDDLESWGNAIETGEPGTASYDEAQAQLDGLQADLETCR